MKTSIVLLVLFAGTSTVLAQPQLQRGVYSLSGSLGFSSSSTTSPYGESNTSEISLFPSLAYFVLDHIELSVGPSYLYASSEVSSPGFPSSTTTSSLMGIRLGLRYYFQSEKIAPFVGANGGVSWSKVSGGTPFSPPLRIYAVQIGADYFVAQTFALEPMIQYGGVKTSGTSETGFNIVIGAKYFIL
ncbi:MAG: outer membrane beta-barrel protein [Bacteroidota bacterium]